MSFENNGAIGARVAAECKPDYETQAGLLKKSLEATKNLEANLLAFSKTNDTYRFNKISSLAEFIGGLMLIKNEQTKQYERLLQQIEK